MKLNTVTHLLLVAIRLATCLGSIHLSSNRLQLHATSKKRLFFSNGWMDDTDSFLF